MALLQLNNACFTFASDKDQNGLIKTKWNFLKKQKYSYITATVKNLTV